MRVAICEWTTFPASVEDELAAYRAAGAGGIGILEFKTAVGRVLDLVTVVRALEAGGYDGSFDVEIFSDNGTFGDAFPDSLWDVETGELARRAVESMARL